MSLCRSLLLACTVATVTGGSAVADDYPAGDLLIGHPWSTATPPMAKSGAGYMTIRNTGSTTDRLVEISSPVAGRIEAHEMTMDGDIMRMRPVPEGVVIAPGETIMLAPGGLHLMMMELREPLKQGEEVPVTLRFERAGPVSVMLDVEPLGSGRSAAAHEGHQ